MIISFQDKETEQFWRDCSSRKLPPYIQEKALNKLVQIDAARTLADLKNPPGNNLEILKGDLKNYHSIRINRQWRIIFIWQNGDAHDVKIVDYH